MSVGGAEGGHAAYMYQHHVGRVPHPTEVIAPCIDDEVRGCRARPKSCCSQILTGVPRKSRRLQWQQASCRVIS